MADSTKCAALGFLVVVLCFQVKQLYCSALPDVESEELSSSEFKGEKKSWKSSQPLSQHRLLQMLRDRKRGQDASVERDNSLDDSFANEAEDVYGARRMNLAEVELDGETKIPVQQLSDKVEKLPGQPPVKFAQYAGYVTVNETAGRALFYYFVEAPKSPEKKPLILWLNGGPGCSSVGAGAFQELGPFRVNKDGMTLYRNPHAWNKVANIIFLESPAGVGFSYSNTTSDYTSNGDARTASDSLTFLLNWFQRFPQYKNRDFYLCGESYAGNYVPELAQNVAQYNKNLSQPFINLKGFMVGNAVINTVTDLKGAFDYWWTHATISDETYAQLQPCVTTNFNAVCQNLTDEARLQQGNIDYYDIYTPICLDSNNNSGGPGKFGRFMGYDPCEGNYVTVYLNLPDVQDALHANVTKLAFPWQACSDIVNEDWQDSANTVLPIYKEFIAAGLKIWVYSGDVDSVVPVTATKYSLGLLELKITVPWYAWYLGQQVGGYTQGYDGLTFVTIRDSGHLVPLFQPARALALFTSFITGVPLSAS